jgi:hypothetical protein
MINKGMEDIKNNPYFKKKVEDDEQSAEGKETDKVDNKDKPESVMISKDVIAEQIKDTVVLSKIGPKGHKEKIKAVDVSSDIGRQLTKMIDKGNMTEEDVFNEKIKEITMNSKRLSLSNYL